MIYAIVWKGKGASGADWYQPMSFDTREKFNDFKTAFENIGGKYWTYIEEITFEQKETDIPYNDFAGSLE